MNDRFGFDRKDPDIFGVINDVYIYKYFNEMKHLKTDQLFYTNTEF